MERAMLGIFLLNRITNEAIRKRITVTDIAQRVNNFILSCFGRGILVGHIVDATKGSRIAIAY